MKESYSEYTSSSVDRDSSNRMFNEESQRRLGVGGGGETSDNIDIDNNNRIVESLSKLMIERGEVVEEKEMSSLSSSSAESSHIRHRPSKAVAAAASSGQNSKDNFNINSNSNHNHNIHNHHHKNGRGINKNTSRESPSISSSVDKDFFSRENNILRLGGNRNNPRKPTGMSVRCHCNLASCVHNNYMCKSERRVDEDGKELEAGCFLEELDPSGGDSEGGGNQHGVAAWNGRVANARRGCIEMLSREKQKKCSDRKGDPIVCCMNDMCNYPKSFYPSNSQTTNLSGRIPTFDSSGIRGLNGQVVNSVDHQAIWLRAALIAVPICGICILIVLILVARKLLKSDEDYKNRDTSHIISHKYSHSTSTSPRNGLQPVFFQPPLPPYQNEYLIPKEHCCCQMNSPRNSGTQDPGNLENSSSPVFPLRKNLNANNSSSETEELVSQTQTPHICICSSNNPSNFSDFESESQNSLSSGGFYHRPPIPLGETPSRRFNFLSKIGLGRGDRNSRPFNV